MDNPFTFYESQKFRKKEELSHFYFLKLFKIWKGGWDKPFTFFESQKSGKKDELAAFNFLKLFQILKKDQLLSLF